MYLFVLLWQLCKQSVFSGSLPGGAGGWWGEQRFTGGESEAEAGEAPCVASHRGFLAGLGIKRSCLRSRISAACETSVPTRERYALMWLTVKIIRWFAGERSSNAPVWWVWNLTNLKGFLLYSPPQGFQTRSSISNLLLQTSVESSIDFYYEWTVLGIESSLWNVSACINLMDDISDYGSCKRTLHVWLNFMREMQNTFHDILLKKKKDKSEWSGLSEICSSLCLKWVGKKKIGGWMEDLPYKRQTLACLL